MCRGGLTGAGKLKMSPRVGGLRPIFAKKTCIYHLLSQSPWGEGDEFQPFSNFPKFICPNLLKGEVFGTFSLVIQIFILVIITKIRLETMGLTLFSFSIQRL